VFSFAEFLSLQLTLEYHLVNQRGY